MFSMKDVVQELYEEFPEIEPKAIDKICRTGLMSLLKFMRQKEEVIIRTEKQEFIKFYLPMSPEKQSELTTRNILRRKEKLLKSQNGEKSE